MTTSAVLGVFGASVGSWLLPGAMCIGAVLLVVVFLEQRSSALRDELKRKRDEHAAALVLDEAILEAVLETMDEGVVVADPEGRFVIFNRAARRITGRDPAEITPDTWPEVFGAFHADAQAPLRAEDLILRQAMSGREPAPRDAFFAHGDDGEGVHARGVARPVRDEAGTLLGGALVMLDTTERRRAAEQRAEVVEDLERRNAELGRFTYTVSHELRSPLVTIKGFLGLLRRDAERGDMERLTMDMDRISEAVETMSGLLEDLLELSRSGVVVDAAGRVDLGELLGEVVRVLDGRIAGTGASVRVSDELPTIRGDRRRLFEVFQNLLENALKFMGDQPTPLVEISVREAESEIVCCVKDNGIGISEEDRERVFRVFERVEGTVEGSGVGLALVKSIVEAHGGSVWVESSIGGVGSTFCFSLPRGERAT